MLNEVVVFKNEFNMHRKSEKSGYVYIYIYILARPAIYKL